MTCNIQPASVSPCLTAPSANPRVETIAWIGLLLTLLLFLVLRVPLIYLQPGGQDEDCYAVPGLTVLSDGLPRLPNVPARNPESVFYKADVALFAEPPLYFYWQAIFYAVLPPLYGTARLSSVVAALGSLTTIFWIGKRVSGQPLVGFIAALLFSFSRWFYFGATSARPDQLSGLFGLLAIAAVLKSRETPTSTGHRERWLAGAGVMIGLGGLSHVLAMTYALPLGLWVACDAQGWRQRIRDFAIISGIAVLVALAWLPMIITYPDIFKRQFQNQFMIESGDSLLQRFRYPLAAWRYQFLRMTDFIGAPQMLLAGCSLCFCLVFSGRRRQAEWLWLIATSLLSAHLVSVCLGEHHLGIGYWVVPAGISYLCAGSLAVRLTNRKGFSGWQRAAIGVTATLALLAIHVPGCGLRGLMVYWQHRHDAAYNAPRFAQELLREIPAEARCSVDAQFLLDVFASGRPTVNLQSIPKYFLTQDYPYDYMIVSRFGIAEGTARKARGRLVKTLGVRDDPFACYVEIYRPGDSAEEAPRESAAPIP